MPKQFLLLTNTMTNCSQFDDNMRWDFSNLEFEFNSRIALSRLIVDFKNKDMENAPMEISTNLVERNILNPNGTLISFPAHVKDVTHNANILEFWRIDSMRPRSVLFTFRGVDVSSIVFFSAVLAIETQ